MIEAYVGMPGAGKTYLVSRRALKAIRRGKKEVWANFALKGAHRFRQFPELYAVRNALVVLDEAGLMMAAAFWKAIPFEVLALMREHRHDGLDVIYTAQSIKDVATALRRVTQYVHFVSRLGPLVYWQVRDYQGHKGAGGFCFLSDSVFSAYDTHEKVVKPDYVGVGRRPDGGGE